MKYHQPYGITDENAPYINGDPSVGRQGSIIPAEAVEYPQRELTAAISASGMTPDDASLEQLLYAVRSQRMNYAADVGAPNAVLVEFDPPIASMITPGMPLRIKAAANNTGTTTLSTDGVVHPLRHADATELTANEVKSGVVFGAVWNDGGYWEFDSYMGGSGGGGGGTNTNTFINIPFTTDTGAVNALIANFVPAITTLVAGLTIEVKLANNVTGSSMIAVNGLAPVPILRANGSPLQSGDAVAGQIMLLIYSATAGAFQFSGLVPKAASGLGPVGSIVLALGAAAFAGTLKLNGAMLVRSEHPLLWAYANSSGRIVSEANWQNSGNRAWTSFSLGDGATTFRLPDFRGEFMRFFDDGRGIDVGRLLAAQQDQQVGSFTANGNITVSNLLFDTSSSGSHPINTCALQVTPGANSQGYNVVDCQYPSGVAGGTVIGLSGNVSMNINAGGETRPRNAPVVACIVDG